MMREKLGGVLHAHQPVQHRPRDLCEIREHPTSGEVRVACTTAGGCAVFVVSDLPDADNLAVARLLASAVRAHLAGAWE